MSVVTLTEVTDPLCIWCWGAEALLRRVEETYRDQVELEFVTGGLVADFESFRDPANGITEPHDVARHWETAAEHHGMPVDADLWRENPPESTYPANRAYHAASFQDETLACDYLRRLREAATVGRRDISSEETLVELAADVGLDPGRFRTDLGSERAREAFRTDRQVARRNGATGFPSFRVTTNGAPDSGPSGEEEAWIRGYRPFESLAAAIERVAPDVDRHEPRPLRAFVAHHDRVATREVAEVYDTDTGRAIQLLRSLEDEGVVRPVPAASDYFWEPVDGGAKGREGGELLPDGGPGADDDHRDSTPPLACRPGGGCGPGSHGNWGTEGGDPTVSGGDDR